MKELQAHLASVADGDLNGSQVDRLLASCWDELNGSDGGGMLGRKLIGRMEDVRWQRPILSFRIERHGGTVCGSTRAELQHWKVDLENETASIVRLGKRQLVAMAKRISAKTIADEIVRQILAGDSDQRIRWLDEGSLKVMASVAFPTDSGFKQTIAGRRKRLIECVAAGLERHGWSNAGGGKFVRSVNLPESNSE